MFCKPAWGVQDLLVLYTLVYLEPVKTGCGESPEALAEGLAGIPVRLCGQADIT